MGWGKRSEVGDKSSEGSEGISCNLISIRVRNGTRGVKVIGERFLAVCDGKVFILPWNLGEV